jgi:para-nitrobenzyl esterase
MTSLSGRTIRAFTSIPFAAPPVDELRFKAPQKVKPWDKVLRTQQETPKCVQINPFARTKLPANYSVEGQEDCLYLNVYAPESRDDGQKLPVLVWIHGGVSYF